MALAGRLAIVAGGLGGIGSATGRALLARGARLAILYAPFERSKLGALVEQGYPTTTDAPFPTYECDITSSTSVRTAFSSIQDDLASSATPSFPSILANCAGYVSLSPLEEQSPEEISRHLNNNILGPMLCSQAFAKLYFRHAEEASAASKSASPMPPGRIVSIASQAAHVALDKHGAYCASKAGLIGLTKCMASEWGGRGITANTVSPGVVWTALGRKAWPDEAVNRAYQQSIPSGRFAEPEEVAECVAWLCGDGVGMVNGADVRLDGGFTIR